MQKLLGTKANNTWVKPVEVIANITWRGDGRNIHTKVMQKMQQVLTADTEYGYLQPGAKQRLKTARQLANATGLNQFNILPVKVIYLAFLLDRNGSRSDFYKIIELI